MVNEDISSREDFKIDCGINMGLIFKAIPILTDIVMEMVITPIHHKKKCFSLRNIFGK